MLPEHILSVKYLGGQLLLFSIIEKTAAVLLNPPLAPQGLVKPARASKFFCYCYHLVADFCCAVKPGWASVDQHQMSVALALNRLSPSILGFMNIYSRDPGNGKSNLLIWQCDDNSECTIEKFCRDLILF